MPEDLLGFQGLPVVLYVLFDELDGDGSGRIGYDELDAILERYVEQDMSAEAVIRDGFDRDTVYRVVKLTDRNEYKRRQSAPGLKVTTRAFGMGRRVPIAQRYRDKL